jgi:hypothetical protein
MTFLDFFLISVYQNYLKTLKIINLMFFQMKYTFLRE